MSMVTNEHKRQLVEQGYCVLRQVIDASLLVAARRAINISLSQGVDVAKLDEYRHVSWCPELCTSSVINDLMNHSAMVQATEEFLGKDSVTTSEYGQVALRFPQQCKKDDYSVPGAHLDGTGNGKNGIPDGTFLRNFSALAVCILSEQSQPWSGNFTVWPGSHHFANRWFLKNGNQDACRIYEDFAKADIEPVQVCGDPGDVIIAHHLTFHAGGPNMSDAIRYACIFRLVHSEVENFGEGALYDPWREWSCE
ncbi:MAG: phytanoyl-CoA dioxygenase family protein [Epibacterium sp.]|nr:phytanoyl-CoA dioxygenase family protein [Epibacterium sp.]NQX74849.1 phytanoyl-CoA dioxygenase family protein [Epibacterium sp.]